MGWFYNFSLSYGAVLFTELLIVSIISEGVMVTDMDKYSANPVWTWWFSLVVSDSAACQEEGAMGNLAYRNFPLVQKKMQEKKKKVKCRSWRDI